MTLRASKARLSALVERAAQGEEVIITVRGKPRAKLCPVQPDSGADTAAWGRELQKLRARYTRRRNNASATILDAQREERL